MLIHGFIRPTFRSYTRAWLRRHPFIRDYLMLWGNPEPLDQALEGARLIVRVYHEAERIEAKRQKERDALH